MFTAGIDIGSRNTKAVIWDTETEKIVSMAIIPTGSDPQERAEQLLARLLKSGGNIKGNEPGSSSKPAVPVIATGYGRKLLGKEYISEISCHAAGIRQMLPNTRTIVDIGGQDSKAISLNDQGCITEFTMNDKCAAGTGSFLERVAGLFSISLADLGEEACQSGKNIAISSTCVVFAESEIISLINRKTAREDILMAVHRSIAQRIKNMLSNIAWQPPLTLTGGVALNKAICLTLSEELQTTVQLAEEPFYSGALGAALFAAQRREQGVLDE
jgi:predicted CoA-substrate-specific enzyme activase